MFPLFFFRQQRRTSALDSLSPDRLMSTRRDLHMLAFSILCLWDCTSGAVQVIGNNYLHHL